MLLPPDQFLGSEDAHRTIKRKDCTVVESCFYEERLRNMRSSICYQEK